MKDKLINFLIFQNIHNAILYIICLFLFRNIYIYMCVYSYQVVGLTILNFIVNIAAMASYYLHRNMKIYLHIYRDKYWCLYIYTRIFLSNIVVSIYIYIHVCIFIYIYSYWYYRARFRENSHYCNFCMGDRWYECFISTLRNLIESI